MTVEIDTNEFDGIFDDAGFKFGRKIVEGNFCSGHGRIECCKFRKHLHVPADKDLVDEQFERPECGCSGSGCRNGEAPVEKAR